MVAKFSSRSREWLRLEVSQISDIAVACAVDCPRLALADIDEIITVADDSIWILFLSNIDTILRMIIS